VSRSTARASPVSRPSRRDAVRVITQDFAFGTVVEFIRSRMSARVSGREVRSRCSNLKQSRSAPGADHNPLHRKHQANDDPPGNMFNGRFGNTTGRPYVEALVNLPRLGITSGVSFLGPQQRAVRKFASYSKRTSKAAVSQTCGRIVGSHRRKPGTKHLRKTRLT